MTPEELRESAYQAIQDAGRMTLVLPRPFKGKPKGFPRGELLCEQQNTNVYSFDPHRILKWLDSVKG